MSTERKFNNRPKPSAMREDHFHGLLLIDKPAGFTSHDVVHKIRGCFKFKKVGHGGTLDPMATGLLVILLGKNATRVSAQIMGGDKTYEGTMFLGISTNTQDAEGQVVAEGNCEHITADMIENEMRKWRGDILQIPPMVSAIKRNGVPLYKIARKDQEVERAPRLRHVYSFKMLDFALPQVDFKVKCTKGTYVRTLCADIGEGLGCGAHLSRLRRTMSGNFDLEQALTLDQALAMDLNELESNTLPVTTAR